jgi:hypothetical protein
MVFGVTISTEQDAFIQFFFDFFPLAVVATSNTE